MMFLPATRRGARLLACATLLVGTGAVAETIDLFGSEAATLGWEPATGPVVGYYVVVSRNADPPAVHSFSVEPQATIDAEYGDAVIVYVSAFDSSGVAGPISLPSPTLKFNAPPVDPPPDDPPPDDPPPDDPPPDDPPYVGPGTALDFDGDGSSDLLVREATGELSLWRMDGSKVIGVEALDYLPPSWAIVGNGDYDGNGVADVLWQEDGTQRLIVWLMTNGAVEQGSLLELPDLAAGDDWRVGGSGDFDGDGRDDLMLFSRVLGESEIVYLADGQVASRERMPGYVGAWSVEATTDVDGDGLDEIVWRDERAHALVLWDLDGAGPEAPLSLAESVEDWRTVGSGDFDGDGSSDLIVASRVSNHVQVWRLEAGRIADTIDLPEIGSEWLARGVGDYDFDGRVDALWFDPAAGGIEIWFSDGNAVSVEAVSGGALGSASVVSGAAGSDDADFLGKLCGADFSGDGSVGIADFSVLTQCMGRDASGGCEPMDLDSDGSVGTSDLEILRDAFGAPACSP